MKKQITALSLLMVLAVQAQQGVAINTDGSAPDNSAILDVQSTTKGFLPPRLTSLQRDAINAPAEGLVIYNTTVNCLQWYNGNLWYDGCSGPVLWNASYVHCNMNEPTEVVEVTNPTTGRVWMDRNLGASQVASSSTDALSYGSLFQWGRFADGHQCVNRDPSEGFATSSTTSTLSPTSTVGHSDFILAPANPSNWLSPSNDNLWQNGGINNPCPSGFRVPTEAEFSAERNTWSTQNAAGAFGSVLKIPLAGARSFIDGGVNDLDTWARFWTSNTTGSSSRYIRINTINLSFSQNFRALGASVRCIKD